MATSAAPTLPAPQQRHTSQVAKHASASSDVVSLQCCQDDRQSRCLDAFASCLLRPPWCPYAGTGTIPHQHPHRSDSKRQVATATDARVTAERTQRCRRLKWRWYALLIASCRVRPPSCREAQPQHASRARARARLQSAGRKEHARGRCCGALTAQAACASSPRPRSVCELRSAAAVMNAAASSRTLCSTTATTNAAADRGACHRLPCCGAHDMRSARLAARQK